MFIILISIILLVLHCILKVSANTSKIEDEMRSTTVTNRK